MRIGGHVSAAGSLDKAIDRAVALDMEAVQIFGSPPQGWAFKQQPPTVLDAFVKKAKDVSVDSAVYMHGVYLVNLATENPEQLVKGVDSLTKTLTLAGKIGSKGVIFHVGSHRGVGFDSSLAQIASAMTQALQESEGSAWLIIENNAGQGGGVGGNFHEIGQIMGAIGSPRVKVCLDTQHSFASGYDLSTADGVARSMDEFDREIGLDQLVAVHANDSKITLGGGRDRHENIGDGFIGREGFLHIMRHPAFKDVPFLLEVPGIDGLSGPDAENVRRLKEIRAEAGL